MGNILTVTTPSKLLLLGEHIVLYGYPALGVPLPLYFELSYKSNFEDKWIFENVGKGYHKALNELLSFHESLWPRLSSRRGTLSFKVDVPLGVGYGSSASLCVSVIKLFNELLSLNLSESQLWDIANESEKVFHGTPSGIDTGLIIRDRPSFFIMDPPLLPRVEDFEAFPSCYLVVGSIVRKEPTKKIIENFKERLKGNLSLERNLRKLGNLVSSLRFISKISLREFSYIINESQILLRELGFSHPLIDKILSFGLSKGALAAKMSGAGKGGCFFFIVETEEDANNLEGLLRSKYEKHLLHLFSFPL